MWSASIPNLSELGEYQIKSNYSDEQAEDPPPDSQSLTGLWRAGNVFDLVSQANVFRESSIQCLDHLRPVENFLITDPAPARVGLAKCDRPRRLSSDVSHRIVGCSRSQLSAHIGGSRYGSETIGRAIEGLRRLQQRLDSRIVHGNFAGNRIASGKQHNDTGHNLELQISSSRVHSALRTAFFL